MMQSDDDLAKLNKNISWETDEGDETGSGEEGRSQTGGGQAGQIAYRDFLADGKPLRDDLLTPEERKRLLLIHKERHENRVEQQKELRDIREALRNQGKVPAQAYGQGLGMGGGGMENPYKPNPALADKVQFSGHDEKVNELPSNNKANTNEADRKDLENQYQLRYALQNVPRFNPKPQYNG